MSFGFSSWTLLGEIGGGGFWMPTPASTTAEGVDLMFDVILWISIISFVLLMGATAWFAFRYRKRSENQKTSPIKHNMRLELVWSVIPSVILLVLFWYSQRDFVEMSTPPAGAIDVRVIGSSWSWTMEYPAYGKVCKNKLVVPKGEPVSLTLSSRDVIHSFFVPAFRLKKDAVPNRYTGYWFEATETGVYDAYCTEYCGQDHSLMRAQVHVKSPLAFEAWLESDDCAAVDATAGVEVYGDFLFKKYGCNACHSLDGSKLVGPTLKGLFGKEEPMADGSKVLVDAEYLRESLQEPNAKVVQGYTAGQMPTFKGRMSDKELETLIDYLKLQAGE